MNGDQCKAGDHNEPMSVPSVLVDSSDSENFISIDGININNDFHERSGYITVVADTDYNKCVDDKDIVLEKNSPIKKS